VDILPDLDDRFASLILDHDENRGTQDVDGANDRREPPIEINLRPAEGSLGGLCVPKTSSELIT